MAKKILASSLRNKEHLQAYDETWAARLAGIDKTCLIPNLFDTVPADALPWLAKQYGLTGYNGWRYVVGDEAAQRQLLKDAIALKKTKGTEYGIKNALDRFLGISNITITKGAYLFYPNGQQLTNGSFTCSTHNPFTIQISLTQTDYPMLDAETADDMIVLVLEYKAAREYLVSVNYETNTMTGDTFGFSDTLNLIVNNPGPTPYTL